MGAQPPDDAHRYACVGEFHCLLLVPNFLVRIMRQANPVHFPRVGLAFSVFQLHHWRLRQQQYCPVQFLT